MEEDVKVYEEPADNERETVQEEETQGAVLESPVFDIESAVAEIMAKLAEIENKIKAYDLEPIIASLRTLVNITDNKTEDEKDYNGGMY